MPAEARKRIDFVIGGVQKGGTTALDDILSRHPGIAMAEGKELHVFDTDENFADVTPDFALYHAFWGDNLGRKVCGETTPSYLWWPPAAQRIRDYNPAMRWIVLLRDPATRAYSHWNMERARGAESLPFEAALDAEVRTLVEKPGYFDIVASYLSRGFYAQQIERLWSIFPREQTLILRSDALRGEATPALARVFDFLGVAPMAMIEPVIRHVGEYEQPMHPGTRANLARFFEPEIRRLEALLGWDCADWRR